MRWFGVLMALVVCGPAPEEVTITRQFSLDAKVWSDGIFSTRPCQELRPRD